MRLGHWPHPKDPKEREKQKNHTENSTPKFSADLHGTQHTRSACTGVLVSTTIQKSRQLPLIDLGTTGLYSAPMRRLPLLLPLFVFLILTGTVFLRSDHAGATAIRWYLKSSSSSSSSSGVTSSSSSSSVATTGSGALTGSGVLAPPEDPVLTEWSRWKKDREKRTADFRTNVLLFKKKERPYWEGTDALYKRRSELRQQCRDDLRKANRDQKFPTILRCYRAELGEYQPFLKRQYAYYSELPGIDVQTRRDLLVQHKRLSDAVDAILYGIDSDVYSSGDELLEAKKNLRELYQTPVWEWLSRARASRDVTWIAEVLQKADTAMAEEKTLLSEVRPGWNAPLRCLMEKEVQLRTITDEPAFSLRKLVYQGSRADVSQCLDTLTQLEAATAATASGAVLPAEGELTAP